MNEITITLNPEFSYSVERSDTGVIFVSEGAYIDDGPWREFEDWAESDTVFKLVNSDGALILQVMPTNRESEWELWEDTEGNWPNGWEVRTY